MNSKYRNSKIKKIYKNKVLTIKNIEKREDNIVGYKNKISLLLTSTGLTTSYLKNVFHDILSSISLNGLEKKIAVVVTASMYPLQHSFEKKEYSYNKLLDKAIKKYKNIGKDLNLPVNYIDCSQTDINIINNFIYEINTSPIIWITGGNTFFLWKSLKLSGMDKLIYQRVIHEGAFYVGCSAGSIIAGDSIIPAFWKTNNDPLCCYDLDWTKESNYLTFGFTPKISFFPHYNKKKYAEIILNKRKDLEYNIFCLTDDGRSVYIIKKSKDISKKNLSKIIIY